jgi:hypothetical protein
MEEWKGGLNIPIEDGARVGGRGERARLGKIEESSNSHGKKKGGREERWTD